MSAVDVMKRMGLVDFETLLVGLRRNLCDLPDLSEFVDNSIRSSTNSGIVDLAIDLEAVTDAGAAANTLESHIRKWSPEFSSENMDRSIDKWRLACLCSVDESNESQESKLSQLQEIYSSFGFPEDMAECSIYNESDTDPLIALTEVIHGLKTRLGI